MGNIPASLHTTFSKENENISTNNDFNNFYEIIDYIATDYILTMDFQSLKKLTEREYCDKLVILTSDIIERYFNNVEIQYLEQRVKKGEIINTMDKDNVIFFQHDQLNDLDVKNDAKKNIKKKRVCIGIAKFYIKIAHIFSAILMTINPVYSYHNEKGDIIRIPLLKKEEIPDNISFKIHKINICDNRIRALTHEINLSPEEQLHNIRMMPKVCEFNMLDEDIINTQQPNNSVDMQQPISPIYTQQPNSPADMQQPNSPADMQQPISPINTQQPNSPINTQQPNSPADMQQSISPADMQQSISPADMQQSISPDDMQQSNINNNISLEIDEKNKDIYNEIDNTKKLTDEPGIDELMQLYLDDEYDYSTGIFNGMSDITKKKFENDLYLFYTTFTGNKIMPPEIKKFSDIKLRDYHKQPKCNEIDGVFRNSYKIAKNDILFIEYAKNIQIMIQNAASKQKNLLEIINNLFAFVINPFSDKKQIRINPKLTDELLQELIVKTREIIISLYVDCERNYVNGIKIYEAIIESKILETTKNQIERLEIDANDIIRHEKQKIKHYNSQKNNTLQQEPPPITLQKNNTLQQEPPPITLQKNNTLQQEQPPITLQKNNTLQLEPPPITLQGGHNKTRKTRKK